MEEKISPEKERRAFLGGEAVLAPQHSSRAGTAGHHLDFVRCVCQRARSSGLLSVCGGPGTWDAAM